MELGQLRIKVNKDIRAAMDHMIGLSGILTELCVATNRSSVASAGSGVGLVASRSSDIGGGRIRQVAGTSGNPLNFESSVNTRASSISLK